MKVWRVIENDSDIYESMEGARIRYKKRNGQHTYGNDDNEQRESQKRFIMFNGEKMDTIDELSEVCIESFEVEDWGLVEVEVEVTEMEIRKREIVDNRSEHDKLVADLILG